MDADIFCGVQNAITEEDYVRRIDTVEAISRNINQSGKPVLWTIAGNLDMLPKSYNSAFFSDIYCLVLIAEEETVRDHMVNGRGISDLNWVDGSVAYNGYLKTHNSIGDLKYDTLSIDNKSPETVADEVIEWIRKLNKNTVD